MKIGDIVGKTPVIPVLTLAGAPDGVPVARALVTGGLPVMEVTLRTAGALEAVKAITAEVKGAIVGVGTVLEAVQFEKAKKAGAAFAVSPGFTPALIAAAADAGMPFMPAVSTVSEALTLRERGFRYLKFFRPSSVAARTSCARWPRRCPTCSARRRRRSRQGGGLPDPSNVPCVGGSWVVPADAIVARDWAWVEALASKAAGLGRVAHPPRPSEAVTFGGDRASSVEDVRRWQSAGPRGTLPNGGQATDNETGSQSGPKATSRCLLRGWLVCGRPF